VSRLVLFNKPYGVLSQFTPEGRWRSLAEFIALPGVYPAGRLDADSEGLLLLTDDGGLQHRIADPRHKLEKIYWAQVEGLPTDAAVQALQAGVSIGDYRTRPCRARLLAEPQDLWPRDPPIRFRQNIPTAWLEIGLREGKNRQVRRMCAAVGFPVLRLVRASIGALTLEGLPPGQWRQIDGARDRLLAGASEPKRRQLTTK
jgi:23S rRNA pseudouridine2457 synthase